MAVKYKIYQSNRKDAFKGKWYARAVHDGTVTTDDLADIMQDNCTVKRSDIPGGNKRAGRGDDHPAPELHEGENRPLRNLQAGHLHITGRHGNGLLRKQQHKERPRALPA